MAPAAFSLLLVCAFLAAPGLPGAGGAALAWHVVLWGAALLGVWLGGWRHAVAPLLLGLALLEATAVLQDRFDPAVQGRDVQVTGTLCEFPKVKAGVARFAFRVENTGTTQLRLPDTILLSWYDVESPPAIGERWRLRVRLRPPHGFANPGGFDYERWLFSRRIGASGWVRASGENAKLAPVPGACPAAGLRGRIADAVRAVADGPSLPYLLGLSVGAYQALPDEEWELLRRTGTVHLVSISGFHVALIAAPAALLGAGGARLLLRLGVRAVPRVAGALMALGAGAGYGVLAGLSVPTIRSVLMLLAVTLVVLARRNLRAPAVLALALVGVLAVDPLAPLTPGFWLSFAGVLVLVVVLASPGGREPATRCLGTRLGGAAWDLVRTQLAMTIALAPLLVLFFGQIPLSGALANLVAIPLFSFLIVPFTLLGALTTLAWPAGGGLLLAVASMAIDLWRGVTAWCAGLPLALWFVPEPPLAGLLCATAGAAWLLWPRPVPCRTVGLLLLTGLLAGGAPALPHGGLRITVLDVGQGLAVLVETATHAMLYDAGPSFRDSDAGERVVVPALRSKGLRKLDLLLISHADLDHRGGAASLLQAFPTARLLEAGDAGVPGQDGCVAGTAWEWDGVHFRILHPVPGATGSRNDRSCVLSIRTAEADVLLPGDIERAAELDLVQRDLLSPVDLVVAPHHGSATSSSAAFVSALRPRYVVYAAGHSNRWNFPRPEVVAAWKGAGACGLVTGEEGALQFISRPGEGLHFAGRYRRDEPRLWRVQPATPPECTPVRRLGVVPVLPTPPDV